jgi:D-alanyl-D-alanine carboxypeptidase (penicillin-binding protein 5/6)
MNHTYNLRPIPQPPAAKNSRPKFTKLSLIIGIVVILLLAYVGYALLRPVPAPQTVITPPVTPALVKVNIPWPKSAPSEQAAYGADGYGVLAASSSDQTPAPTASVAKVITAMAILQRKPLKPGEQGPSIPLTTQDVAIYNKYVSIDGSVVPVYAGESMTEYQALQAMLLPSANNIADTMAVWAFGSLDNYTAFANQYVKQLGMVSTNVADASGFSPNTVSTASDLVRLGDAAMDNDVITEIVNQSSAEFPGYGTIHSTDMLLGQSGIRGIKTGNTDQAGGVFLGAADVAVGSKTIRVITAVMSAPTLSSAMRDTLPLVQSTPSQFQIVHAVRTGQAVGKVTTAWGETSVITAGKPIEVTAWTGTTLPALATQSELKIPTKAGDTVGSLKLNFQGEAQSTDLKLASPIQGPSLSWRLTHPL